MKTPPPNEIPNDQLIALLRGMMRIRCLEETLADRYKEQEMQTPTHFSIGQEATAVGVCAVLGQQDVLFSGHRRPAHYLAKGGPLLGLVGEQHGDALGIDQDREPSAHFKGV